MKFLKFIFLSLSVMFILAGSCLFYAFKVEPYRLQVNTYSLTEQTEETVSVKIVQFSDVHIKKDFTYENLHKVVNAVNRQNPDIVLFTGDLYDNYAKYNDDEHIIAELKQIEAKYGKIAIWGNRDYGGGAAHQYETIMGEARFTLLKNENWYITVENDKTILFTGLDDGLLGTVSMPDSTKLYDSDYDILLSHEPDQVIQYQDYSYHLTLSGHSHGGQVRIPFLPFINAAAVSATSLSTKYVAGMYSFGSDGNAKLYVNTGIGTTHISARFGVVPEISVFYLYL